jgi:hypothetical protein
MDFQKTRFDAVKCVHLAIDKDDWLALVNMVINFRVPKNAGEILCWLRNYQLIKNVSGWATALFLFV